MNSARRTWFVSSWAFAAQIVKDVFGDLAENILHCAVGVFLIVETQDGSVVATKTFGSTLSRSSRARTLNKDFNCAHRSKTLPCGHP